MMKPSERKEQLVEARIQFEELRKVIQELEKNCVHVTDDYESAVTDYYCEICHEYIP